MSALEQQDGERKAVAADLDATEQKDAKNPRDEGAAAAVSASCCAVPVDALKGAAKKKTEQAAAWKKLFDEAQEEANSAKEKWAAAEVKAYRSVSSLLNNRCLTIVAHSSLLLIAA